MYAWIWHKLPFGRWGKAASSIILVTTVGVLLWYLVFPWATPLLPFDDVQVGTGQGGAAEQDPNAVIPGEEGAPDELPYSDTSNAPHPSASPGR